MAYYNEIDELMKQVIELLIKGNDYYEKIGKLYNKSDCETKDDIIYRIYNCYEDFGRYPIYTIMDNIEEQMTRNKTLEQVIDNLEIED